MCGAVFPPCWSFEPEMSQHWHLGAVGWGRFWHQNGGLQDSSHQWVLPSSSATSVLVPAVSHSCLPPPQETLQDQQVSLAQAPVKSLLFPLGPVCTRPCGHPPRVESLFPPVLWHFGNQAPLAFKAKCSGGSSPDAGPLGWEAWRGAQSSHSYGRTSAI